MFPRCIGAAHVSSRDCDNMQRNCTGPNQTKSQHGEGGSGHIFTPKAEDLTPLAAGRRGSFLNGVTPGGSTTLQGKFYIHGYLRNLNCTGWI